MHVKQIICNIYNQIHLAKVTWNIIGKHFHLTLQNFQSYYKKKKKKNENHYFDGIKTDICKTTNTFWIVVFTKHPANNWIKHLFALEHESIELTILQTPPILSHLYNQLPFSVKRNKLPHISIFYNPSAISLFTKHPKNHCPQFPLF